MDKPKVANEPVQTLDYYVGKALDYFETPAQPFDLQSFRATFKPRRTLVVGSQSGYWAGVQVFRHVGFPFISAKEMQAQEVMDTNRGAFDCVVLVSASGTRQIVDLARHALLKNAPPEAPRLPVYLITCKHGSVRAELEKDPGCARLLKHYHEFYVPASDEPPTINTCTYGGMLHRVTNEDLGQIRALVHKLTRPAGNYATKCAKAKALTVVVSDRMEAVGEMIGWKINGEIIGRQAGGICKYLTNLMHGAFVVDAPGELYVGLGLSEEEHKVLTRQVLNQVPASRKLNVQFPGRRKMGPLAVLLAGYSIVGLFQRGHPYTAFQDNVSDGKYKTRTARWTWLPAVR